MFATWVFKECGNYLYLQSFQKMETGYYIVELLAHSCSRPDPTRGSIRPVDNSGLASLSIHPAQRTIDQCTDLMQLIVFTSTIQPFHIKHQPSTSRLAIEKFVGLHYCSVVDAFSWNQEGSKLVSAASLTVHRH